MSSVPKKIRGVRSDLGHKIRFARVFWPEEVDSVPFLSLGRWSSGEIPAGRNRRDGEEFVEMTLSSPGSPQFIPCQILAGDK